MVLDRELGIKRNPHHRRECIDENSPDRIARQARKDRLLKAAKEVLKMQKAMVNPMDNLYKSQRRQASISEKLQSDERKSELSNMADSLVHRKNSPRGHSRDLRESIGELINKV